MASSQQPAASSQQPAASSKQQAASSNSNNRKGGDDGVGSFVFDEGLAQGSSSSGRNGSVMAEPAQRKASKKRSAMGDLMNRGGASVGSRF